MTHDSELQHIDTEITPEAKRKFDVISNTADRSAKTAWSRKMDNMVKLLAKLHPIEEQIQQLAAQKMPIFDEVYTLRELMVAECVHPQQYLEISSSNPDVVICKFCETKITLPT